MTSEDTITVVMIDDNPVDLRTMDRLLDSLDRSREINFIGVQNPDESLEDHNEPSASDIDLVFLDYKFPGRDGFSVLSRLRKEGFENPIVMLTGQGNESVAGQAVETTLSGYLSKEDLTTSRLRECLHNNLPRDGDPSSDSTATSGLTAHRSLSALYRTLTRPDADPQSDPSGLLLFRFEDVNQVNQPESPNTPTAYIEQTIRQLNKTLPSPDLAPIHERTYALLIFSEERENISFESVAKTYRNHLSAILADADVPSDVRCFFVKINRKPPDPSLLINRCLDQFTTGDTTSPDANNIPIRKATNIIPPYDGGRKPTDKNLQL